MKWENLKKKKTMQGKVKRENNARESEKTENRKNMRVFEEKENYERKWYKKKKIRENEEK